MTYFSSDVSSLVFNFLAAQAPAQPSIGEVFMRMMPMFVMVLFIFYFMIVRPQNQKIKAQQELLKNLKKGDGVVLSSGMFGKFQSFDGEVVVVEIAANTKIRVEPSSVVRKEKEEKKGDA